MPWVDLQYVIVIFPDHTRFLGSPEHGMLKVSYLDQSMSVVIVRLQQFPLNDIFNQTSQECSLDNPLQKIAKKILSAKTGPMAKMEKYSPLKPVGRIDINLAEMVNR